MRNSVSHRQKMPRRSTFSCSLRDRRKRNRSARPESHEFKKNLLPPKVPGRATRNGLVAQSFAFLRRRSGPVLREVFRFRKEWINETFIAVYFADGDLTALHRCVC